MPTAPIDSSRMKTTATRMLLLPTMRSRLLMRIRSSSTAYARLGILTSNWQTMLAPPSAQTRMRWTICTKCTLMIRDWRTAQPPPPRLDKAELDRLDNQQLANSAINATRAAKDEIDRLRALEDSGSSVEDFFAALPSNRIAETKTDADGRFSIILPSDQEMVLTAAATRTLGGDKTEYYYWVVPVPILTKTDTTSLLLSNDNLTSRKWFLDSCSRLIIAPPSEHAFSFGHLQIGPDDEPSDLLQPFIVLVPEWPFNPSQFEG